MSLTREEVEKVSLLARLLLTPEELDRMTAHLGQIVAYVESLSELDTTDVEPMANALDVSNVFSPDMLRPVCRAKPRWPTLPITIGSSTWFQPSWANNDVFGSPHRDGTTGPARRRPNHLGRVDGGVLKPDRAARP